MALDKDGMADDVIAHMKAAGFDPLADTCAGRAWWVAFCAGVISHIEKSAEVKVGGGSSSGTYKVE